jgi:hypothetical protein
VGAADADADDMDTGHIGLQARTTFSSPGPVAEAGEIQRRGSLPGQQPPPDQPPQQQYQGLYRSRASQVRDALRVTHPKVVPVMPDWETIRRNQRRMAVQERKRQQQEAEATAAAAAGGSGLRGGDMRGAGGMFAAGGSDLSRARALPPGTRREPDGTIVTLRAQPGKPLSAFCLRVEFVARTHACNAVQ